MKNFDNDEKIIVKWDDNKTELFLKICMEEIEAIIVAVSFLWLELWLLCCQIYILDLIYIYIDMHRVLCTLVWIKHHVTSFIYVYRQIYFSNFFNY